MKVAVEFPSVMYREGPQGVARLAQAIEAMGYDQIDMFDHVVMGHPIEGRTVGPYPAKMPILEALMTLSYFAAATERIGLGTEILVLPQRQPALVAKQVSTLDTLSGGRVRLGVGVGWQESEYEALGAPFQRRGAMMDEAIRLLRAYWADESVTMEGTVYPTEAMAMEPKPPRGAGIPIWVGGSSPAALKRVGTLGDGWLAPAVVGDPSSARETIATIQHHAEAAGRAPSTLGFQAQLSLPPRSGDAGLRDFYAHPEKVVARAAALGEAGFGWVTVNATGIFLAGARRLDALIDELQKLRDLLHKELG